MLDVYLLVESSLKKNAIKAVKNRQLCLQMTIALSQLHSQGIPLHSLAKHLNIHYTTLWRYLHKSSAIPLLILKELEHMSSIPLRLHIDTLTCMHSQQIQWNQNLTPNYARIIGAIISDGHLENRNSERGNHYTIVIREGCHINQQYLAKWISDVFDLTVKPIRKENCTTISFDNRILFLILTNLFNIPTGEKSSIVKAPLQFKGESSPIRLAFLQGLFLFDGGVNYHNGYVTYSSVSKDLFTEVLELLTTQDLHPNVISLRPDAYGRYSLAFSTNTLMNRAQILFLKGTEKWERLQYHLTGTIPLSKDLKEVVRLLDTTYPRARKSAVTFGDVIAVIEKHQPLSNKELREKIKRKKTTTYELLHALEQWNVITSCRNGPKYYSINKKLTGGEC